MEIDAASEAENCLAVSVQSLYAVAASARYEGVGRVTRSRGARCVKWSRLSGNYMYIPACSPILSLPLLSPRGSQRATAKWLAHPRAADAAATAILSCISRCTGCICIVDTLASYGCSIASLSQRCTAAIVSSPLLDARCVATAAAAASLLDISLPCSIILLHAAAAYMHFFYSNYCTRT